MKCDIQLLVAKVDRGTKGKDKMEKKLGALNKDLNNGKDSIE